MAGCCSCCSCQAPPATANATALVTPSATPTPTDRASTKVGCKLRLCCVREAKPLGPRTPPTIPTNGETVIEWAKSFADIITTVAALGASLTFTVIVSDIADPKRLNPDGLATEARFDRETVRKILAIGWLLFVTAFGWAVLMSLVVRNASPKWIASYNRYDKTVDGHEVACNTIRWLIAMLSLGLEILGLEILITAAFMYLGFAVGYTSSQLNWPL